MDRYKRFLVACDVTLHPAILDISVGRLIGQSVPFLGSGPKGLMSFRTQGGISRRPSVRPSFRPSVFLSSPPVGHQNLKFALLVHVIF